MSNIEIEIQVQVENIEPLLSFLQEHGTKGLENRQIDTYYTPANKHYTAENPVKEWLRLRNADGTYSINYKHFYYKDGKSSYCDEYETSVDSIEQMQHIFTALDIQEVCVVDKKRSIYTYKDYEIALDSVQGLGDFVEIEHKGSGKAEDAAAIKHGMVEFLKECGVGKIRQNFNGYPYQLLFPEQTIIEELS
jgi:adenylate cyclase class 2